MGFYFGLSTSQNARCFLLKILKMKQKIIAIIVLLIMALAIFGCSNNSHIDYLNDKFDYYTDKNIYYTEMFIFYHEKNNLDSMQIYQDSCIISAHAMKTIYDSIYKLNNSQ